MGGTIVCDATNALEARSAAELAHAVGARLGLRIVLVRVAGRAPAIAGDSELESIVSAFGGDVETRVVGGERAEALAQVAAEEGADLIVVGSRFTGFGTGKLRCALARELAAATPVPVLVAPPSPRRRTDRRLAVAADAGSR